MSYRWAVAEVGGMSRNDDIALFLRCYLEIHRGTAQDQTCAWEGLTKGRDFQTRLLRQCGAGDRHEAGLLDPITSYKDGQYARQQAIGEMAHVMLKMRGNDIVGAPPHRPPWG